MKKMKQMLPPTLCYLQHRCDSDSIANCSARLGHSKYGTNQDVFQAYREGRLFSIDYMQEYISPVLHGCTKCLCRVAMAVILTGHQTS